MKGDMRRERSASAVRRNHAAMLERNRHIRMFGHDPDASARFVARRMQVPAGGRVLEVGTGNGRFTVVLARRTGRLVSCDLDRAAMRRARLNLRWYGLGRRVHLVWADATRLPFRNGSFDMVVSVNTIHHLGAPLRAVREMVRVLRSGGTLVVADFNSSGFRAMDRLHCSEGNRHVRGRLSMGGVRSFLKKRDMAVRRFKGCNQDMVVAGSRLGA